MRHRPAQADHQHREDQRGQQAGEYRHAAGDIAPQLAGDLRAGQGIAESRKETDQKQRFRAVATDDPHRGPLVPDVEHHDQAQQHRGRDDAAAGGIGQAQGQRPPHRTVQGMADVKRQRQADQGRQGVRQQVFQQALASGPGLQPGPLAQPPYQQPGQHREQGEAAQPGAGQGEEIPGHAPARTVRGLVHQAPHFIRRTVGPQAPGVDQVFIEVELVLDIVDARTDGAQQAPFHQQFRRGRGRRRGCCGSGGAELAAAQNEQHPEQDRGLEIQHNAGLLQQGL